MTAARSSTSGFPATKRLKRPSEFAAVFDRGKVAADDVLVMHAVRSEQLESRIGLSVSKKVGNSPERNRWKRLIRESFRRNAVQLPTHLWLVVRPRRGAVPDFHAIQGSLVRLAKKLERKL